MQCFQSAMIELKYLSGYYCQNSACQRPAKFSEYLLIFLYNLLCMRKFIISKNENTIKSLQVEQETNKIVKNIYSCRTQKTNIVRFNEG